MNPVKQYVYGHTLVEVHSEGWVRVVLPDGRVMTAVPELTPEYAARSRALGYSDDGHTMNLEHDRLHAMLAYMLGLYVSPALLAAAGKEPLNALTGAEEDAVLALHRFVNELRAAGWWPPPPAP